MSDGIPHAPKASQPPVNPNTTPIDKNGDLILVMGDPWTSPGPKFLISSRVLSLASKFFTTLFEPYLEDNALAILGREVPLDENDTASLKILLSVLHYHDNDNYDTLSLPELVDVAGLAKKYECGKALKPWATQWFRNAGRDLDEKAYGHLLLAACHFKSPDLLKTVSVGAIKTLPLKFRTTWRSDNFAAALPQKVKDAVAFKIMLALRSLRTNMEAVEPSLRRCSDFFTTRKITCPYCARVHCEGTKYCRNCENDDLYPALCTKQSRVAEYFAYLGWAKLWPTVSCFHEVSITELVSRVQVARQKVEDSHWCQAKGKCPLRVEMKDLAAAAEQLLKGIEGVEVELV